MSAFINKLTVNMLQNFKTDVSAIYHLTGQAKLGSGLPDPGPTSANCVISNLSYASQDPGFLIQIQLQEMS